MKCQLFAAVLIFSLVYVNSVDFGRRRGHNRGGHDDNGASKWKAVDQVDCPPSATPDTCNCKNGEKACSQCNRCFCGGRPGRGMWMCTYMACPPAGEGRHWAMAENINTGKTACQRIED